MEEARDEHGRLIGEAHTSGRLRGADMLDASEAASSLFALQQVLQRDDAPATTKALRALTNGIRARDDNAKQTCAEWARSSPRLAELFHAYSAPGGRDADSKTALHVGVRGLRIHGALHDVPVVEDLWDFFWSELV